MQTIAFIYKTRELVLLTLSESNMKIYFDLGVEMPGLEVGQNTAYLKRFWRDYVTAFGTDDTYGFSVAWYPGRFTSLINIYDSVGVRPQQYAVDLYDFSNSGLVGPLTTIWNELKQKGEEGKPILIQETWYSNQRTWEEIRATMTMKGMKIRSTMQWQLERDKLYRPDGEIRHFSTTGADYLYFGEDNEASGFNSDIDNDGDVDIFDYNLLIAGFDTIYTLEDYDLLVSNFLSSSVTN